MELTLAKPLEHGGIGTRGSSRVDPVAGPRLREVKHLRAVAIHGRAALFEIEPAVIDLRNVREQIRLVEMTLHNELVESSEQLLVGDCLERNFHVIVFCFGTE